MPRNNTIARIFRTIKLSEISAQAFIIMFYGWTSYYKRKPVVAGDFDYYKISFYLKKKENIKKKVTENQRKVIAAMRKNPYITIMELKEIIGISRRNILENIGKLKSKKLVEREGPDKGGRWIVSENPKL